MVGGENDMRDEEMDAIKEYRKMELHDKVQLLRAKRIGRVEDVLEEVSVLIDSHFDNEFTETKSSAFLNATANQNLIDSHLFKRTWTSLNCTPKTLYDI